ncbi:MAG: alpha/beta fold hydrolase [Christensenellales bacterium]|jgi:pimeloyl-ACP methyl ester carboxylesterase
MANNVSLPFAVSRPVIGGISQAVLTAQDDPAKPLLLIVHGGPGEPVTPFCEVLSPLMERFVVCLWEQRGAGMSYSKSLNPKDLCVTQYVADTIEVSRFLLSQFKREKLVLMGFSWGTLLGILAASHSPELYSAYVGVGQIFDQRASEKEAFETALLRAKEAGDTKSVEIMESLGPPPYEGPQAMKKMLKERTILRKYSGHKKQVKLTEFLKTVFSCPYYTFSDKVNYFRGMRLGAALFPEVLACTPVDVSKVDVPVCVIQGEHDMQTMPNQAKRLIDLLDTPKKQFILFENAGHSPVEEDPEGFAKVIDSIEGIYEPWVKD